MIRRKKDAAEAAAAEAAKETEVTETAEKAVSDTDLNASNAASADTAPEEAAVTKDEREEHIARLTEELEDMKDQRLRVMAEYDNFRKRTAKEKLSMSAEIKADCINALLPVIDNLERALSSENADADTMRKGVEMVLSQARTIFESMEVKAFGEPGDRFDPQLHHCVSTVEADDNFSADQITIVMQKGYMIGDRVIRPAMVQVAN